MHDNVSFEVYDKVRWNTPCDVSTVPVVFCAERCYALAVF